MKKSLVFVLCFFVLLVGAYSTSPLRSYLKGVDDETYELLVSGVVVKESTTDGDLRRIAPESDLVDEKIEDIESMKKGFGVAIASMVEYPEEWEGMSDEEKKLELYNTLLSISTQTGITYISHRAGDKEKVLFEETYMLGSADKRDRIDDPVVTSVPLYAQYYSYQDDTSFGGNIYTLAYTAVNDEIFLEITNYNDLKFLGLSLVKKGKVNMSLDFIEADEGIYVFAIASVEDKKPQVNVLFYKVDLELSFYNRIVALSNWFMARLGS